MRIHQRQGGVVNRRMGLAKQFYLAAHRGIAPSQRARAPITTIADFNHDVGVGAKHHETAPAQLAQPAS